MDGDLVVVGWNMHESVFCKLTIFNAMTDQIALCRKYQDLWFLLSSMHSFDLSTKAVTKLQCDLFVALQ